LEAVTRVVNIPVVASGGAGSPEHLRQAFEAGADAALAASIFHYNEHSIPGTKAYLAAPGGPVPGVPVREGGFPVRIRNRPPSGCGSPEAWRLPQQPENGSSSGSPFMSGGAASFQPPSRITPSEPGLKVAAAVPGEPQINQLFRTVMLHKGSDLHLKAGLPGM